MDDITLNNINSIQYQIGLKLNYNVPYYATRETAGSVMTDMDHFPYKRFYRGVYDQDHPVIMEREAGFRPRHDMCYTQNSTAKHVPTNYCWEYPCSLVPPTEGQSDNGKKEKCKPSIVIAP